jgi:Ca2+-binding EF-hand superfamily protein
MTAYLTSVFVVMFETTPSMRRQVGVGAAELAAATAAQCFSEFDLNHDARLSIAEFRTWYEASGQGSAAAPRPAAGAPAAAAALSALPPSVLAICQLTRLRRFGVGEVAQLLAEFADQAQTVSRADFCHALRLLRDADAPADAPAADASAAEACARGLFDIYGRRSAAGPLAGAGRAPVAELLSGLSVLCRGDHEERVKAAFGLHDSRGTGFISLAAMGRYLAAVYRLLYAMKPSVAGTMNGVGPDELAAVTAKQGAVPYHHHRTTHYTLHTHRTTHYTLHTHRTTPPLSTHTPMHRNVIEHSNSNGSAA